MQKYSNNLVDLFYNSPYAGAISGADVIVKNENEENGEIVKIYLVVRDNVLQNCSFQAMGSIVLYASLTTICSIAKDKTLDEILAITEKDVINELKQLNKQEYSEIVFALESFKKTVTTYNKRKAQGTIVERTNLKTRSLHPSKNITIFGTDTNKVSEIEIALAEKISENEQKVEEPATIEAKAEKKQQVEIMPKTKSTPNKSDKNLQKLDKLINEVKLDAPKKKVENQVAVAENPELMIVPVGGKKKAKRQEKTNVVIPTKIEVRVLEDEDKKQKTEKVVRKTTKITTTTKKTTKKPEDNFTKENPYLIQPEPVNSSDEEVIDEIDSITEQLTNAISQLNFKFDDEDKN